MSPQDQKKFVIVMIAVVIGALAALMMYMNGSTGSLPPQPEPPPANMAPGR